MSTEIYIADNGECLLGGHPLHPPQGALQAAQAELAGLLKGAGPADTLVLAGSGLGWHAKAAASLAQGPQVVVFEPDPRRRALAQSLGPDLTGVDIVSDVNALAEALGQRLVYSQDQPGRVAVFAPRAYRQGEPELVAQAKEVVQQALSRSRIDLHTRRAKQETWLDNLRANFKYVLECPDVTRLAQRFQGLPAVVVGAGPSLDESLAGLAGLSRRALFLGAASAIGPLARVGEALHLAVALEAKDESRQFGEADPARTWLAAATSGHCKHFTGWPGSSKALFHLQPWAAELSGGGLGLPNGGHATSAAFALAVLWGCDPIVLVGQDLAYSGGRIHAQGRPGGEDEQRPEKIMVPAIGGGQAETSPVFLSYISWYQETAAYLAKRGSGPRVINATAQGARLDGFEHLLLQDALAQLPRVRVDRSAVARRLRTVPRPKAGEVVQNLMASRAQVRRCLAALENDGLSAALAAAGQNTAAAAALADLAPGEAPSEAAQRLERMSDMLKQMAEDLYA